MKKEDIQKILEDLDALKCKTAKDVEEARVRYLGKRGEITALFEEFRSVDGAAKREFGHSTATRWRCIRPRLRSLRPLSLQ